MLASGQGKEECLDLAIADKFMKRSMFPYSRMLYRSGTHHALVDVKQTTP